MSKKIALRGWDWPAFKVHVFTMGEGNTPDGIKAVAKLKSPGCLGWTWECENCSETGDWGLTWREAMDEAFEHAYGPADEREYQNVGCENMALRQHIQLLRQDIARKDLALRRHRLNRQQSNKVVGAHLEAERDSGCGCGDGSLGCSTAGLRFIQDLSQFAHSVVEGIDALDERINSIGKFVELRTGHKIGHVDSSQTSDGAGIASVGPSVAGNGDAAGDARGAGEVDSARPTPSLNLDRLKLANLIEGRLEQDRIRQNDGKRGLKVPDAYLSLDIAEEIIESLNRLGADNG